MTKRFLVVLVLTIITVGGVFAQTDFGTIPKNTVTVDVGPTIVGALFGAIGDSMGVSAEGISVSGFGIAAQYERQILERVSVAGRFAYLGVGMGVTSEEEGIKAILELKLSSFSLEGHARYFPFGKAFFLDGMLGYANMWTTFSGEVIVTNDHGNKEKASASVTASRSYIKLGAKLGWRIDFGKPGGFIFEPSIGWYGAIGLGDTLGETLAKELSDDVGEIDASNYDDEFGLIEKFIFIGGPRVTLAFGWRF